MKERKKEVVDSIRRFQYQNGLGRYANRRDEEGEEKDPDPWPKFNLISAGKTNPKTAKHPDTKDTYKGAILHLEPYVGSGKETCPFATAIYKIVVDNSFDSQTLELIKSSPGYQDIDGNNLFFGFELKSMIANSGWGRLSDTLLPKNAQEQCPLRMKIRLPGKNLKDWDTGATIQVNRNQIIKTNLVGGCANSCLNTAGAMHYAPQKIESRRRKTLELQNDSLGFLVKILLDTFRLSMSSQQQGHKPVIRMNGTSDIFWERDHVFPFDSKVIEKAITQNWPKGLRKDILNHINNLIGGDSKSLSSTISALAGFIKGKNLMQIFKNVQWYDYTKSPSRIMQYLRSKKDQKSNWPSNYHLTFSLAEGNRDIAKKILARGGNVAVVFNVENTIGKYGKKGAFPKEWAGFPVYDADAHDYRFLDEPGTISGLRAKAEAQYKESDFGFVVQPDDPDLDPNDPAVIQAKEYVDRFEKGLKDEPERMGPGVRNRAMAKAAAGKGLSYYLHQ
jgi:hypothetical protein